MDMKYCENCKSEIDFNGSNQISCPYCYHINSIPDPHKIPPVQPIIPTPQRSELEINATKKNIMNEIIMPPREPYVDPKDYEFLQIQINQMDNSLDMFLELIEAQDRRQKKIRAKIEKELNRQEQKKKKKSKGSKNEDLEHIQEKLIQNIEGKIKKIKKRSINDIIK